MIQRGPSLSWFAKGQDKVFGPSPEPFGRPGATGCGIGASSAGMMGDKEGDTVRCFLGAELAEPVVVRVRRIDSTELGV